MKFQKISLILINLSILIKSQFTDSFTQTDLPTPSIGIDQISSIIPSDTTSLTPTNPPLVINNESTDFFTPWGNVPRNVITNCSIECIVKTSEKFSTFIEPCRDELIQEFVNCEKSNNCPDIKEIVPYE
ncbi:hypothetical protein HDU92_005764 [Lobulomyces angularis]|nr:hypothetical protein HDU92_005764 [Lobulomyces angularis]